MDNLEPQYVGQELLKAGFKTWFRYLFRLIENRPFVLEPIHDDLFEYFEQIYTQKKTRAIVSLPPRAGKTVMSQYFVIWCITNNPASNIIYTSYSQSLLTDIALKVANILEHPVYKAMYPQQNHIDDVDSNPIDDFWKEHLITETGKNTYSSKKITTYKGGVILFSSVGASITGFGAGIRNSKKFGGMLIIDDPQKPADIKSQLMRDKVVRYYEETLLSRLNNANVPIVCIQQRLHIEDLSGVLEQKYRFDVLRKPLVDDNDKCQIPSQYTPERIEELKTNNYLWQSQYQQMPIIEGGEVIKTEWFKYYDVNHNYRYKRLLITADTAMKVKEHNDFSVFIVGGVTETNQLHVLDMIRGKWEAPELKKIAAQVFEKYKYVPETGTVCSGLYIEDKASGIGLIQELKRIGIPIVGLVADKDKLTRVESILSYIESGQVYLPCNSDYGFNKELLTECERFTRDDSHAHDDIVDALAYNIQEALAKIKVSILDFFDE